MKRRISKIFIEFKSFINKNNQVKVAFLLFFVFSIFSIYSITEFLFYKGISEKGLLKLSSIDKRIVKVEGEDGPREIVQSSEFSNIRPGEFSGLLNIDAKLKICVFRVSGNKLAYLENRNIGKEIIDDIVHMNIKNVDDLVSYDIQEDVSYEYEDVSIFDFKKYDSSKWLKEYILKGTDEKREYIVKKGDFVEKIALNHGMKLEDLYLANEGLKDQKYIHIGDRLNLIVPVPLIKVRTTQQMLYEDEIQYSTVKEPNNSMYVGESSVKISGKKGKKEVLAKVISLNGKEVEREILRENVIEEPKTRVLYAGTVPPPPRIGTGDFRRPLSRSYALTGYFGEKRGRRTHRGIDLAIPRGTKIKAADGGVVTLARWHGNYGYTVIINHGANMSSLYAHCSSLLVREGDKVFKGESIARSGNTGRSTGPHLHFEIRKNGRAVNPANYINF